MSVKSTTSRPWPLLGAGLFLIAAWGCASVPSARPSPAPPAPFPFSRLADSVVASPPLHRAHWGILVYDPEDRRALYEWNGERHFVPASNEKLWPTATALHLLGPDFRYRTPVWAVGLDLGAGVARALVVVGRGDPTFSSRFHPGDWAVLDSLAFRVRAYGVRRVTGPLVVDASAFDEAIIPGTWTFGNLNTTSAPPTGAFAVGEGIFQIRAAPGPAPGTPGLVQAEAPAGLVPLLNRTITTEADSSPPRLEIRRGPWNDTVEVRGEIPANAGPRTLRVPMTDPVRFAAHALAEALQKQGVVLEGGVQVVRTPEEAMVFKEGRLQEGEVPSPMQELTVWESPPLREIVANILGPSQNWMAEQLVRTLGVERGERGSWREGIRVMTEFLVGTVGIDSTALVLQDGSGMSHQNLVTPRAVVQLLDFARRAPWGEDFRAALAAPGKPGTLSNRLLPLQGRLEGKTGTLSSVNALSGYLRTAEGRELIFSILSNASGLGSGPVVSAIDRLVAALADGGDAGRSP